MSVDRGRARAVLGVAADGRPGSLAEAVHAGAGWRPILACALLSAGVLAQVSVALAAPAASVTLGVSAGHLAGALDVWAVAVLLSAPVALRLALSGGPRPLLACAGGLGITLGLGVAAAATSTAGLAAGAGLGGAGTTVLAAALLPLLAESYPAGARMRVQAVTAALALAASGLAPLLVVVVPEGLPVTWRAGTLALAGLVAAASLAVSALPERVTGGRERTAVRRLVDAAAAQDAGGEPVLRLAEAVRRCYAVATVRPALAACAAAGLLMFLIPLDGGALLGEGEGQTTAVAGLILSTIPVAAAAISLGVAAPLGRAFRAAPSRLVAGTATALAMAAGGLALAAVPVLAATLLGLIIAVTGLACAAAGVVHLVLALLPASLRGTVCVLGAVHVAAGYLVGGTVAAGIDASYGVSAALGAAACVAAACALLLRRTGGAADADFDRVVDDLVEREQLAVALRAGRRAPLLTCRRLRFSYGALQVLFDVDIAVEEGEMVALLGTNGAGKSTLLRCISGVGLPRSGTIRLRGRDITYADPSERVRLGVTQIPGGKAVFGPLSVADNLRLYGYALGRDRRALDRGIEEGFAAFPRLAERRNAAASTLSGGEQQMLALTKALILRPALLLIDELSLGLAPRVVGELLELVRRINSSGTAVVLVEQSVNVALTLAQHAYFMEKGEVRFDGATAELLERPDVLRSVFLQGAATGMAS